MIENLERWVHFRVRHDRQASVALSYTVQALSLDKSICVHTRSLVVGSPEIFWMETQVKSGSVDTRFRRDLDLGRRSDRQRSRSRAHELASEQVRKEFTDNHRRLRI